MEDKLQEIEQRFERLTADLGNPEVIGDRSRFSQVAKERAQLEQLVETFREYRRVRAETEDWKAHLGDSDPEMREMARGELPALEARLETLERAAEGPPAPERPERRGSVILEIRAGAGGDEAGLFAEEVMQMYLRYAERKGWKAEHRGHRAAGNAGGVKDATVTLVRRAASHSP